jgi:hypothetical protein
VRLQLTRGADATEMDLCFRCDQFRARVNGKGTGGGTIRTAAFVPVVKKSFPADPTIQSLAP